MTEDNRFINGFEHFIDRKFILAVQMGKVPGATITAIFAENPSIASATPADIWDFPDEPIYTFSTTAAIDTISSDNAGDSVLMVILGLDGDFKKVTQTATLNGLNKVTLGTPLLRVTRIFNGNGTDLLGNVYLYENTAITAGVPDDSSKVRAYAAIAEQSSLMGVLTVPAGVTGFFLGLTTSISRLPSATACVFTGKVRTFEGTFLTAIRYNMTSTGSSHVVIPATAATRFPEKTDFVGHASVDTNATGVSATFDLLCLENDKFGLV